MRDNLPDYPDCPSDWSIDRYSLLSAGDIMTRNIQIGSWAIGGLRHGETTDMVFTMDNLAGVVPVEARKNLDHPQWVAKLKLKQPVTFK